MGVVALLTAPPAVAGQPPSTRAAAVETGSFGIQLLDAPVGGQGDPRANRYIVDHLAPGESIQRRVLVVNKSDHRLAIDLYPAAASIADQQFQFGEGRSANDLTGWIAIATGRAELEAGAQQEILVTIAVPVSAPRGERYAVIWASVASNQPVGGSGVQQINRVGVRVYLDVGPGGDPITDFAIGDIGTARDPAGAPSVTVDVDNTGERALDLTGSLTLSGGPAGLGAGPFPVTTGTTLAPGDHGMVTIALPVELPNGPWTMDLTLASGVVVRTATATMTFPEAGLVAEVQPASTPPWWVLGIAVAVALLVLIGVFLFARSRAKTRSRVGL